MTTLLAAYAAILVTGLVALRIVVARRRVPCRSCGGQDTAAAENAQCYNCRNRLAWENEALLERLADTQHVARIRTIEIIRLTDEAARLHDIIAWYEEKHRQRRAQVYAAQDELARIREKGRLP